MTPTVTFAVVTLTIAALATMRRPARPPQSTTAFAHSAERSFPPRSRPRDPSEVPAWFRSALVETGISLDPTAAWLIARWASALAVALAAATAGVPFAALAATTILASPSLVRRLVARRTADRRDAQLPPALERLASSMRGGSSLAQAFAAVSRSTPEPLGSELRATAAEVAHGAGLANALDRWGAHGSSGSEVWLAAAALGLAADAGGEVARSVDRVAATLRERRELRGEVRALATQARASAGVLAAAPLAFTALVASVEPGAITFLLTSSVGVACLVTGLALDALGAAWMAHILRSVE